MSADLMSGSQRLPDFFVVGAPKAGTTSPMKSVSPTSARTFRR